jgi:predicted acyltransferase (DUF342 family)
MAALPSDFDAASFLYLNPELLAFNYSNVFSIESARDFFLNNISVTSNLVYNFSNIPQTFDGRIFLADNKDGINISDLNRTIKIALSNEGYTPFDLDGMSQYLPTVYKDLRLLSNNVFTFKDLGYGITSNVLLVGDDLKIQVNNVSFVFSKVTNIDIPTNSFTVSNIRASAFSNPDLNYLLVGHKIYDAERLSKTNYVRNNRSSNPIFGDFSNRFYGLDPEFNVQVYKLLYPDARLMTDEQCLLDYTSRRNNNDIRIGKAAEIVKSIDYVFTELRNLRVSCNCRVDNNFILNGYWVNGITSNGVRDSTSACNSLLITEKGSKGYVDMYRTSLLDLTNLVVSSNATFCNQVNFLGNQVFMTSTMTHCNDLYRVGNEFVMGNISINNNLSLSNDLWVGRNMTVSNNALIMANLTVASNASFQKDINIGGFLMCSNVVSLGSNVGVSNNMSIKGDGEVYGNFLVKSDLILEGNIRINNSLFIASNVSLSNELFVNSNVYVGSNISVSNLVSMNSAYVASNLVVDHMIRASNAVVNGNFTTNSNFVANGFSTFCNEVTFESNLYLNATMRIGSSNTLDNLLLDVLGGIRADDYLVTSDVRVKKNIKHFDTEYCSKFVSDTSLISYNLSYDKKEKPRYGFLAHELQRLDSNVITHVSDFIPNIMTSAIVLDEKDNILIMDEFDKISAVFADNIDDGMKVKYFIDGAYYLGTISQIDAEKKTCVLPNVNKNGANIGKEVMIYGSLIKDFKAVDYMQMFAICMGALQKTIHRVSVLEQKLADK